MLRIGFFQVEDCQGFGPNDILSQFGDPLPTTTRRQCYKRFEKKQCEKKKKRVVEGWAVWGRMTGGEVWSPALRPEARCDRMAQVKRGVIKEVNFVPGGKIMALRNLGLNRAYHQYE